MSLLGTSCLLNIIDFREKFHPTLLFGTPVIFETLEYLAYKKYEGMVLLGFSFASPAIIRKLFLYLEIIIGN